MPLTNDVFAMAAADSGPSFDSAESLPLRSAETYAEEERTLLWRRCRLVCALGLAISVVLIVLSRGVIGRSQLAVNLLERYETWLDLTHMGSFAAALASLYLGRPSIRRIQLTAFAVVALNAVLVVFSMGVIESDYPLALPVSLMLFIPAAVIPWRVAYQVWLGVAAVASPLCARLLAFAVRSEARAPEFWEQFAVTGVTLVILAATSVLVTHTLYSLRRKAHKAKRLGNYLIERELGHGGMGEVFVARHARMCRPTAVKVLRVSASIDLEALERFEREVQLSSSLTHPNTITIFDYGRADRSTFYYAMEYLEGLDLRRLVRRFGPLKPERAIYLLAQVCGSLAEAHAMNVMHRDLKPSNIFLTQRGGLYDYVKVLDFGLAKQVDSKEHGVTRTGRILGTPEYMAPEAVQEDEPIDTRSDLYCVGAVGYFLLTGRPPFHSTSMVQVLVDQVRAQPRPPSEMCEMKIPPELETVVLRCLEKKPRDRFQKVEELERALRDVPVEEPWTRSRAHHWWQLHLDAIRPVLYDSAPSGPSVPAAPGGGSG